MGDLWRKWLSLLFWRYRCSGRLARYPEQFQSASSDFHDVGGSRGALVPSRRCIERGCKRSAGALRKRTAQRAAGSENRWTYPDIEHAE